MAVYTYRCPKHGDFKIEAPLEKTKRSQRCVEKGCRQDKCPKVLGAAFLLEKIKDA